MTASTLVRQDVPSTVPRPLAPPADPIAPPIGVILTGIIVVGPVVSIAVAIPFMWGRLVNLRDITIAMALYAVSAIGITVGYHRLFTHRSFSAIRPLKIALAVSGSMAVEGSVIGWAANHRRHHRFSDRVGDPHSPNLAGNSARSRLGGLAHAHLGWLFRADATDRDHYVPDLLADGDLVAIGRLWGVFAVGSLVLPFGLGWAISGSLSGGVSTMLWAGLVRMLLLHHVTWGVNSMCHTYGRRPFRTKDRSTNLAALSWLSFGDSFHNLHHAYPSSARHGVLPHQWDGAAATIRWFERLGWASGVRWPDPERLAALRRGSSEPTAPGSEAAEAGSGAGS